MEKAIHVIQDRIIYLTGQITLYGEFNLSLPLKIDFEKEIIELKESQEVLREKILSIEQESLREKYNKEKWN